jgi:hypothetical protein
VPLTNGMCAVCAEVPLAAGGIGRGEAIGAIFVIVALRGLLAALAGEAETFGVDPAETAVFCACLLGVPLRAGISGRVALLTGVADDGGRISFDLGVDLPGGVP